MQRCTALIVSFLFFFNGFFLYAQETDFPQWKPLSDNVDSLIQDSVRKAYILNHRPLAETELTAFPLQVSEGFYGRFVGHFLYRGPFFLLASKEDTPGLSYKKRQHSEWEFYIFAFLFLLLGLLTHYYRAFFQKMFRAFVNNGFILKQTREQMGQSSVASFLFNIFFVLSATIFLYLGVNAQYLQDVADSWWLLLFIFVSLSALYLFKTVFLHFIGWMFNVQEACSKYLFVVFVVNKVAGFFLLFSAFFMAFAGPATADEIFTVTLYILGFVLLFRMVKAYTVFFRQPGAGLFSFIVAFLSLELIPTAVLIKWILRDVQPLLTGFI
jgi:hypothetical protein